MFLFYFVVKFPGVQHTPFVSNVTLLILPTKTILISKYKCFNLSDADHISVQGLNTPIDDTCLNHLENMYTVRTFYQCIGNYTHLTVGMFFSFERGVELIHRYHERARVLLLNLHICSLYSERHNVSKRWLSNKCITQLTQVNTHLKLYDVLYLPRRQKA